MIRLLSENVIMDSLMPIELDTPPPSPGPTLLISVLEAPEEPSSLPSEMSRHEKRKKRHTGSRKRKRSEPTSEPTSEPLLVDNDASNWTETAPDTQPYTLDDILTHTNKTQPMDDPRDNANEVYNHYVDAVSADDAPFYQISKEMFVVSKWDVRDECNLNHVRPLSSRCRSQVSDRCFPQNTWYHLQATTIGTDLIVVCTCPHEMGKQCVHERFLTEYWEMFPDDETFDSDGASMSCPIMSSC